MSELRQIPEPGTHILKHSGDRLRFTLRTPVRGKAYLRSNIGSGATRRAEIISLVHTGMASEGQDWRDYAMSETDEPGVYTLNLALTENGHFEAKCYIVDEKHDLYWPDGDNLHINVAPAEYCCANSIYCAFVRQFGPRRFAGYEKTDADPRVESLDAEGYVVIPPSGTFRDLKGELDHIFNRLKCRILHLLPVNPTPSVYARMGRYGSPYASLDFFGIDSSLAEFDRCATPEEQFSELADGVHERHGKLFLDLAVNHTGWASKIHLEHPEWLKRKPDGEIISPGAWGVIWGDLTELDYSKKDLWQYIAEVFLTWCSRGVDGFRCDAGYMIPVPAWEYIIARVRTRYPDTVFLLEGLGGDPAVTSKLLDFANMNWAYSELFQNYSREQVEGYLNYAWKQSQGDGLMVHYAETHDNNRLAAVSHTYAKMRTGLCALASVNGAFGFANGVEWYATEKIDVHEARCLSWGAEENMADWIGRLNTVLSVHPAFHNGGTLAFLDCHAPNAVLIRRTDDSGKRVLLAAVNLDCANHSRLVWEKVFASVGENGLFDLLTSEKVHPVHEGKNLSLTLKPGEVLCLSDRENDLYDIEHGSKTAADRLEGTTFQESCSMALKNLCANRGSIVLHDDEDPEQLGAELTAHPEKFLQRLGGHGEHAYVTYRIPEDLNRVLPVIPGRFLLILSPVHFRARLEIGKKFLGQFDSLVDASGRHFLVFPPPSSCDGPEEAELTLAAILGGKLCHRTVKLLYTAKDIPLTVSSYNADELQKKDLVFLQANGRGAAVHVRTATPELCSRYDALLLANLSTEYPEDRHIMLRRFRIWMSYSAGMQEVTRTSLAAFETASDGGGLWHYRIPAGGGLYVRLTMKICLEPGKNICRISFIRDQGTEKDLLSADHPVHFIIRPDIEDRNFHYATKARDVEHYWPGKVEYDDRGFTFAPAPDRMLSLVISAGSFRDSREWQYMIWQKNEAARGLDPYTDLYSPGYFDVPLYGGDLCQIAASVRTPAEPQKAMPDFIRPETFAPLGNIPMEQAMLRSMEAFIVKRGTGKSVIAGYPWFLDWGRDTLIAARGLIASSQFRDDAKSMILQFAAFADQGTIPNVIYGSDASNRDTSDAPLWLITAAADCCKAEHSSEFVNTPVKPGGSTLRVMLESVADGYMHGTPNGIVMDPESGLIFSPAHFTWMDTNYPAGTPREGYPVEIQALWHAALAFLASLPGAKTVYGELRDKVACSIRKYYLLPEKGYLSDCLHCKPGTSAADAVPDDHLRPNQLFAVTLGVLEEKELVSSILDACSRLIIPGAIRTLDSAPVKYELPVVRDGQLLNDPRNPYKGRYEGNEDTCRKAAYHNGTAWTWVFPSYCEACLKLWGREGIPTARAFLSTSEYLFHYGCISQLAEILDGDAPHTMRGCDAQAWSITELYRVWKLLH